jgi:hypothetical protein
VSETVAVPLRRGRIFLFVAGSAVFVALGVFLLLEELDEGWHFDFYHVVVFLVTIGFCSLIFVVASIKLFDPRPGLVVDAEGIHDNASGVSAGRIPWRDVAGVKVTRVGSEQFLTIVVRDPKKYASRGSILKRQLNRANAMYYGSSVQIPASTLKIEFDQLVTLVKSRYRSHRMDESGSMR